MLCREFSDWKRKTADRPRNCHQCSGRILHDLSYKRLSRSGSDRRKHSRSRQCGSGILRRRGTQPGCNSRSAVHRGIRKHHALREGIFRKTILIWSKRVLSSQRPLFQAISFLRHPSQRWYNRSKYVKGLIHYLQQPGQTEPRLYVRNGKSDAAVSRIWIWGVWTPAGNKNESRAAERAWLSKKQADFCRSLLRKSIF